MRAIVLESLLDRTCAQEKPDKSLAILLRYVVSSFLNHRYLHNSPHGMLSVKLDCQKLRVLVSKLTQQANSSHGEARLIQNSTNDLALLQQFQRSGPSTQPGELPSMGPASSKVSPCGTKHIGSRLMGIGKRSGRVEINFTFLLLM